MANLEKFINNSPLFIPAVSLTAGILSCPVDYSDYNLISLYIGVGFITIASIIYLVLANKSISVYNRYKYRKLHYIWLILCFFGLGIIISNLNSTFLKGNPDEIQNATIVGYISDIQYKSYGDVLITEAISIKNKNGEELNPKNLYLRIVSNVSDCYYGDLIKFRADLRRIKDSQNSFFKGYAKQLENRGILYESKINDHNITHVATYNTLIPVSRSIRDRIESGIERTYLSKSVQNFLISILLGDKQYTDDSTRQLFSGAGISHILALSGLHIGILSALFFAILFPLNLLGQYKLRYVITIVLLWGYTFITGFTPSAVRACAMCTFAFTAIILERKNTGINSLCFAFILILLLSPKSLYDIGFQLSFICAFVIISILPYLQIVDSLKNKYIHKLSSLIFITFIVTASTWVLTSYYFHNIPFSFLFANIIVLPILPIYILFSLIYIALFHFGINITSLGEILDGTYSFATYLLEFVSDGTSLGISAPIESVILWLIAVLLIAIYLNILKSRYVLLGAVTCIVFSLTALILFPCDYENNDFIICNNYNEISIKAVQNGRINDIFLKRYTTDSVKIDKSLIVSIDTKENQINLPDKCDYLIICNGYNGSMKDLLDRHNISKIVIHPSVRKSKEKRWIEELNYLNANYHSIRYQKSLRVNNRARYWR